ncbi:MAG: hypothetical protein N3D80_12840 [Ignavibacterium album]|uniref:hypothetical protein n=1 Tax=Ignavibacterium album TaxID=591197 RepID=UPI0026EF1B9B|nr:hypothetical protein [Ignavibacterium album]MCX8106747.1 hypothetical protein [Ignavibacterium album]
MTQRPKLEVPVNSSVEIELLYDDAIVGRNEYGAYFLYAVKSKGQEYSLFAHPEVHEALSKLSKGDRAVITKLVSQRGSRYIVKWDVQPIKESVESNLSEEDDLPSAEQSSDEPSLKDHLYMILRSSYQDALDLQKELNGMIDIEKAAITLFIARSKVNISSTNGNNIY